MHLLKRVGLAVSIVGVVSISVAAVAVAAGGGMAPGDYVFTNTSAQVSFVESGGGKGAPGFDVSVNRGLNSFEADDGEGTPTVTKSTVLQLTVATPTVSGGGCFVIDPHDFTVSRNLQSAGLHTTLTARDACKGLASPVTGSGISSPLAPPPPPPPPPGGGGLVFPIKVNVTWTGRDVTGTGRDVSSFACASFSTLSTGVFRTAGSTAMGTISALTGTFKSNFAGVNTSDTHLDLKGVLKPACFGSGP